MTGSVGSRVAIAAMYCWGAAAVAAPIDKFVTVQPIVVCDDAGLNCADAAGILASTQGVTNAVWSQAGIAMTFLPVRQFNESDYLTTTIQVSNAATDEGRRLLRTPGQQQSDNPTTINLYFVPDLRNGANNAPLNGFGFINASGVIIGGAPRLDTIAHELGHNLGLDHNTFGAGGPSNVMTDGPSRYTLTGVANVAPNGAGIAQLTAAQIAKARAPLFSVNQFAMRLDYRETPIIGAGPAGSLYGFSPTGYPLSDPFLDAFAYTRPDSPAAPLAGEKLKTIRVRFLPGADVDALLFTRTGWLATLSSPAAVFGPDGRLISSPVPLRDRWIDNGPAGPVIACPGTCDPGIEWPLGNKRVLADGTVEIFWTIDGDSFGQERVYSAYGVFQELLSAQQRPLPAFTAWDDLDLVTWSASAPFDGPVPAPFSAQFEFESGIISQGFFDENGMLSTLAPETSFSFLGEPSYGFVSDLRPDPEPAVEIALAVAGVALPTDVAAPASLSLFGVALLALAARRRASGLTPPITEKARLN